MIREGIRIRADKASFSIDSDVDILITKKNEDNTMVGKVSWVEVDPYTIVDKADTERLKEAEAQFLMDSLWDCGLRPTQGKGSAGALSATENHLRDMQSLTFKLLEKI